MSRAWTEWTGALAWAEALIDWHRAGRPDQWPRDADVLRTELETTVMLTAYAIQAAARLSGRTVTISPDDLGRVRFDLIEAFVDVRTGRALLYVEGLGPTGVQPGSGRHHAWLLRLADTPLLWDELVARVATVIRDHRAQIDPHDAPEFLHDLGNRRHAVSVAARALYEDN